METDAPAVGPQLKDLSKSRVTNLLLWRVPVLLIAIGFLWAAPRGALWSLAFAWIGAACLTNALRCGRVHCAVMGPMFLLLGLASLGKTAAWLPLAWNHVWIAAGLVTLFAYLPEFFGFKYLRKSSAC